MLVEDQRNGEELPSRHWYLRVGPANRRKWSSPRGLAQVQEVDWLKRYIFVRNWSGAGGFVLGRALIEIARCRRAAPAAAGFLTSAFSATAEQDEVADHDLSHVLFLIRVLVVSATRLQ